MVPGDQTESHDGRTQRRLRNLDTVLEAVHSLFLEGRANPSSEELAARSGISLRSIYRYFPDREQLLTSYLRHRYGSLEHSFSLVDVGQGSLPERIDRFVAHRVQVHQVMAPTARVAVAAAQQAPRLAEIVVQRRHQLRTLVDEQFADELVDPSGGPRDGVAEAIDLLCQSESIETLHVVRGLELDRVHAVLVAGVTSLIASR
ncbi:hypothetical protein GCM10028771_17720 [Nocardioides marmoraquaticus]